MWCIRIIAPHFVAGVELDKHKVVKAAPIVKYMLGWTPGKVKMYISRKGWRWEEIHDV